MMQKGSVSAAKDGGPHVFVHEQQTQSSSHISGSNSKVFRINVSEVPRNGVDSYSVPDQGSSVWRKDGVLVVSTSTKNRDDFVKKEENEYSESQSFQWVKPEIHLDCADSLDMDAAKNSNLPSSLTIGIDNSSQLTDHLTDFVFSSTLPDSNNVKQEYGNYLETLENGDHLTNINSLSEPVVSWGSNLSQSLDSVSTQQILIQPRNLLTNYNPETSANAPLASNFVTHINDQAVHQSGLFTSNPHSSPLFDASEIKPNASTVKIIHCPTSNFMDDSLSLNNYPSEISTSLASVNSQQHISTGSLSLAKSVADSGPFSVSDVANDLNLNQLPNFLGLDTYTSTKDTSSALNSNSALNLLDTMGQTPVLQNIEQRKEISGDSKITEDIGLDIDTKQNLNVTTISISNDDEYATKILVDTHGCRQQMYVINTADLNQLQNGTSNPNISHLFVINNHQEPSNEHPSSRHCIVPSEPVISQAHTHSHVVATDHGTTQLESGNLLTPTDLPGML